MSKIAIYTQPQPLTVKIYRGQPVVTFKDIDTLHQRPEGTAGRNFRENRDRFIESEDYFTVALTNDEIRRQFGAGKNAGRNMTVVTKMGYLMLVKSFTDDLAWHIQRQLVKTYFEAHTAQPEALPAPLMERFISLFENQQQPAQVAPEAPVWKMLTMKEAAAYMRVSVTTFSTICKKPGFYPLMRVGNGRGKVFIHREKLDEWLKEQPY